VGKAKVLSLLANEATLMNGQSWLSFHIYICIGFKCISIFLALLQLIEDNSTNVVKEAIYTMFLLHTGFNKCQIAERLICFGIDGVAVFQRCRISITLQLRDYVVPFLFGVHCMAH
jgi:hypothetical protein